MELYDYEFFAPLALHRRQKLCELQTMNEMELSLNDKMN